MVALIYLLVFAFAFWWAMSLAFGVQRGTHLTIYIPTAAVLIGGVTLLGLLISTMFMSETAYFEYWHSFKPPALVTGWTVTILDRAETFAGLLGLPIAFVVDLVSIWWYTITTHITIALVILHLVALFILRVWWIILEMFCGINGLSGRI